MWFFVARRQSFIPWILKLCTQRNNIYINIYIYIYIYICIYILMLYSAFHMLGVNVSYLGNVE